MAETTPDQERGHLEEKRIPQGERDQGPEVWKCDSTCAGRRRSRKRSSQSRERRTSLLFEDTMATYVYVELGAASVATKITSSVRCAIIGC